jgi:hypothetical protein
MLWASKVPDIVKGMWIATKLLPDVTAFFAGVVKENVFSPNKTIDYSQGGK